MARGPQACLWSTITIHKASVYQAPPLRLPTPATTEASHLQAYPYITPQLITLSSMAGQTFPTKPIFGAHRNEWKCHLLKWSSWFTNSLWMWNLWWLNLAKWLNLQPIPLNPRASDINIYSGVNNVTYIFTYIKQWCPFSIWPNLTLHYTGYSKQLLDQKFTLQQGGEREVILIYGITHNTRKIHHSIFIIWIIFQSAKLAQVLS